VPLSVARPTTPPNAGLGTIPHRMAQPGLERSEEDVLQLVCGGDPHSGHQAERFDRFLRRSKRHNLFSKPAMGGAGLEPATSCL
jgi:hypothetical protein